MKLTKIIAPTILVVIIGLIFVVALNINPIEDIGLIVNEITPTPVAEVCSFNDYKILYYDADFIGKDNFRVTIRFNVTKQDYPQDVFLKGDSFGKWISLTVRDYHEGNSLWAQFDDNKIKATHVELVKNITYGKYNTYDIRFYRIEDMWIHDTFVNGELANSGAVHYGKFDRDGYPMLLGRCYENKSAEGYCGKISYKVCNGGISMIEIYDTDFSKPKLRLEDFEEVSL